MKIKCQPADFRVREIAHLPLTGGGEFAVYELTKTSLGTLEALDEVSDRWQIPRQAIAFAGLKDKHAETRQTVTIHRGPRRGLKQHLLELRYLGQAPRMVEPADIQANQFEIVVRDLSLEAVAAALDTGATALRLGIPNYFDDQRFGSLGESGEFIARPWCLGNWERTLWLILADANESDSAQEKEHKRLVRVHWGNWDTCLQSAAHSPGRNILEYLASRPADFRGAIAYIRQDLRSLYLAAYQSDLWNGMLSQLVEQSVPEGERSQLEVGRRRVTFWSRLEEVVAARLLSSTLPLPSARLHDVDELARPLIERVLEPEGMELRQLRVKYPRDSFFSKGDRPALVQPTDYHAAADSDDLYPGKQRLNLRFTLPRGAYATVVIKRLLT